MAYFDVLGWKDVVQRAGDDPTRLGQLRSLVGFYGYLQRQVGYEPHGSALTAFSDAVVVSQRYAAENVQDFVDTLGRYQFAAASNGFFIRGAITVGSLIHDATCVFGPALVRAHQLESKEAKYPRVILDPDMGEALGRPRHVRMLDDHATIDVFGAEFVRDCATPTIVSASTPSSDSPGAGRRRSSDMVVLPAAPLQMVLTRIDLSLGETTMEAAREKLNWLKLRVEAGIASSM